MGSSRARNPSPTTEQTFNQDFSLGVSQRFAREDHTHGTPGTDAIAGIVAKASSYTIAANAITVSDTNPVLVATVDTSGPASEALNTINGGVQNQLLIVQAANNARTVVLTAGTSLVMSANFSLDHTSDKAMYVCISSGIWHMVSRSHNG